MDFVRFLATYILPGFCAGLIAIRVGMRWTKADFRNGLLHAANAVAHMQHCVQLSAGSGPASLGTAYEAAILVEWLEDATPKERARLLEASPVRLREMLLQAEEARAQRA